MPFYFIKKKKKKHISGGTLPPGNVIVKYAFDDIASIAFALHKSFISMVCFASHVRRGHITFNITVFHCNILLVICLLTSYFKVMESYKHSWHQDGDGIFA